MRSLRTVENDAALKRKEILTPATTQGNLEAVMLRVESKEGAGEAGRALCRRWL